MGSSYPPIIYVFCCQPVLWYRDFFLILITVTSTICFVITMLPQANQASWRPFRALIFVLLGLSAGIPFIFAASTTTNAAWINPKNNVVPYAVGGAVYIGGAIIYALRIPERWVAKKFDMVGQSHNIFHVAVIIGAAIHFNEAMNLFLERQEFSCPLELPQP